MNEHSKPIFVLVVDSTGSMGPALGAVKESMKASIKLLKLFQMRVIIIFYGDYATSGPSTLEGVLTMIDSAAFSSGDEVLECLDSYKLCQDGYGGDIQEAGLSALVHLNKILQVPACVIMITDACSRTTGCKSCNVTADQTNLERKAVGQDEFCFSRQLQLLMQKKCFFVELNIRDCELKSGKKSVFYGAQGAHLELVDLRNSRRVFANIFHVFASVHGLKKRKPSWPVLHDFSRMRFSPACGPLDFRSDSRYLTDLQSVDEG